MVFVEISNSNSYQVPRPLTLDAEESNTSNVGWLPDIEQRS